MRKSIILTLAFVSFMAVLVAGIQFLRQDVPDDIEVSDIIIDSPIAGYIISEAPLTIRGRARGSWFFEAQFSAELTDDKGAVLGQSILTTKGDWMTNDFVPFEGKLYFQLPDAQNMTLVFKNANMSGLPEHDKRFAVPLKFDLERTATVKAFFPNNKFDPDISCIKAYPVERTVPYTKEVGRYAIMELLKGVLPDEKIDGYYTAVDEGVRVNELRIENGTAFVDFTSIPDGGSCRVGEISVQINETLKQFPSVKRVVITLNGYGAKPGEMILQP